MKKRLTSFLLVLALSFSLSLPAFAVDDMQYYSFPSVGSGEPSVAMDWPVSPAVSHDGFLAEDSQNLARIMTDLTTTGLTTLKSYVLDIRDSLSRGGTVYDFLSDITDALTSQNVRGTLVWYIKDIDNLLSSLNSTLGSGLATEETLSKVATETTLSDFNSYFKRYFNTASLADYNQTDTCFFPFWVNKRWEYQTFPQWLSTLSYQLAFDGNSNSKPTLYRMLHLLQDTLASEDDRQLAENYKENRQQAETDFLSGQSGKTSLGKGDFSNASQVGGALNDTFNMGGAAKVSDFLSGFGSAGTESQAWFSQTTANNLNAVEALDGTQGVSMFADDGKTMVDVDPDPYNMADIFSRYDWLEGVNMDD